MGCQIAEGAVHPTLYQQFYDFDANHGGSHHHGGADATLAQPLPQPAGVPHGAHGVGVGAVCACHRRHKGLCPGGEEQLVIGLGAPQLCDSPAPGVHMLHPPGVDLQIQPAADLLQGAERGASRLW